MSGRAAAIAICLAAVQPAMADPRSEALLRDLVDAIDAAEEWSAGAEAIRSEGGDTFAEGIAVTRSDPPLTVRIERIRVRDLTADPTGGFSAAEIEVTQTETESEGDRFEIPLATVRDVSMPSFDGAAIDIHRLMTSMARMYGIAAQGEIGELHVPEMIGFDTDLAEGAVAPVETRTSYRDWRAVNFRDGVLERQELGPLTINGTGPDGPTEAVIERIYSEGLDLGALARIFDDTQYRDGRGDGEWRQVLGAIGYSGLSGKGPNGATFRLDEVAFENVEGRQPEKPLTRDWDRLLDPSLSDDQKGDLALEAVRNMYSAWRLGDMRIAGVNADAPAEGAKFSLDAITLAGLSTAGLDSLRVEAVNGAGPGGFGSLGAFEMSGLVFPEMQALMDFAALEADASAREHAETVRTAFAALPKLAHMGIRDFEGGQAGAPPIKLGSFSFDMSGWNGFWAESSQLQVEALEIPRALLELDAQTTEVLDGLGYDRVILGLSLGERWSAETGLLTLTSTASMQGAAKVDFAANLTGATPDWILSGTARAALTDSPYAAFVATLEGLALQKATINITDWSLLDRGFGYAAKRQGLAVEGPAYREQMRGALPFLLSAVVPPEITKLVSGPLQTFLGGGQMLVAEIAPAQPIPWMDLLNAANLDPVQIPAAIGLTLRSEAAPPPQQ